MIETLKKELQQLEAIQKKVNQQLKKAPEGHLRCAINKGHYQYYSGKKYLGKDQADYRRQLAQKDYCQSLSNKINAYIQKLKELLLLYEEASLTKEYSSLHPARKQLVTPLVPPIEYIIQKFEELEYPLKEFDPKDNTSFYTLKGERVRSKSEKIIADTLYQHQIPYRYEMPFELTDRGHRTTIHPDFTVLNRRTGKRWILEHLGMMDKFTYCESAMQRLDLYEQNHLLLGKSLLILHETSTHPLSTKVLQEYIKAYFL